jgi:hypothetical protein
MTNPVEWAEKDLGAQTVWEESQQVHVELVKAMRHRDAIFAGIRVNQSNLEEAERNVVSTATAKAAEQSPTGKAPSQTALNNIAKEAIASDPVCKSFRDTILDLRLNLDDADSKVEALKVKSRALTARMELVAQQLRFYASCKEAETAARRLMLGNPGNNWPY